MDRVDSRYWALNNETVGFRDADGQVVNFPIAPLPSNLADGKSIQMLTQDGSSPATYRACKAE